MAANEIRKILVSFNCAGDRIATEFPSPAWFFKKNRIFVLGDGISVAHFFWATEIPSPTVNYGDENFNPLPYLLHNLTFF